MRSGLSAAAAIAAGVLLAAPADRASGAEDQTPEPTPRFRCGELRAAMAARDLRELDGIDIVARLTNVRFDGTVAYLTVCSPPDPVVICVAYGTSDRKAGDQVILRGAFDPRGADRILLDPCVHFPFEAE